MLVVAQQYPNNIPLIWHHFISESQLDHLGSHRLQVGLVYAAAVPVDAYLNRSANASPLGETPGFTLW
jgi:hypothetical protein